MQNYLGIIESQSRYELQQALLFNPYGLVNNIDNKYGVVDSNNRISQLKNLSNNKGDVDMLSQVTLVNQPLISTTALSNGLTAIENNDQPDVFIDKGNATTFKPETTQEFWVAFKVKTYVKTFTNVAPRLFFLGELTADTGGYSFVFNTAGNELTVRAVTSVDPTYPKNRKFASIPITVNQEIDLIVHISGTDDANDWNFYVDGSLVSKTIIHNETFANRVMYPGISNYVIRLLTDISTTVGQFSGAVGKIMGNYGSPDIDAIQNSLNSSK